jgi:16S rRNA (cytosine1402-N4)-methyltransferase
MMVYEHAPVFVQQVLEILRPEAGKRYLDGTLGGGGHSEQLLERSSPNGQVLGLDWDEEAVGAAQHRLSRFKDRLVVRWANFTAAREMLEEIRWVKVNGILLDLGLSSHHIESPERGFSFKTEARLDMRMDRRQPLDAYRAVNSFPVPELERIIREYGEDPLARYIALAIDAGRRKKAIGTTWELAEIVARVARRGKTRSSQQRSRIHPATRTFQALRIAVNQELENLASFLENAYELLLSNGRIVIISFHSLEDRLVKKAFWKWSRSCLCPPRVPLCRCGWSQKAKVLTPKPLLPSREEIRTNPRARSAKLRAVEGV